MTGDQIREYLWAADHTEDSGPDFDAACVLLASAVVGPDAGRIARHLDVPAARVRPLARRLRANGVWCGGRVHGDWFDEKTGGIAFCLDIGVATGMFERADAGA